jgi:hypothetical protein
MGFLVESKKIENNTPTLTLGLGPCDKLAFPPAYCNERIDEAITNVPAIYAATWTITTWWQAKFTVTVDRNKTQVKASVAIRTTGTITDAQKAAWKSAIEAKWNGKAKVSAPDTKCPAFGGDYDVVVEVLFVASGEDQVVNVPAPGATPSGTHGLGGTQNMNIWGADDTIDVTHEFGHMLGNAEEYFTTNGVDYTNGGTKSGFRDADGGIMNNPSNAPLLKNYELIRKYAQQAMGGLTTTLKAP